MYQVHVIAITTVLLSASSVWAQKNSAEQAAACVAVPVFHCVQHLEGGSAIGHFGHELQCPDDAGTEAEKYIDINENNMFSLDQKDRGQPKVFQSGEHYDEFEVEFSMAEVKDGSVIQWTVLGQTAMVDFSKTRDAFLDCSLLQQ